MKAIFCTLTIFLFFTAAFSAVVANPEKLREELERTRFLTERALELQKLRLEKKLLSKELGALEKAEKGFEEAHRLMFFSNPGRSSQERMARLESFDESLQNLSVELAELRSELRRNALLQEKAILGPIQEQTESAGWLRESLEDEHYQAVGAGLLIGAGLSSGFKRAQPLGLAAAGTGIYLFFKPAKYGWFEKKDRLAFKIGYGSVGVLAGWFLENVYWHLMN